ncbi:MAG: M3 family oligoendopeptidase [Armatimonadota bacterium]|nr:M3 family oligoendopeptidase [Armatimonadota bacterium]MDR7448674.1 M3 family oligoendopeptidase [Armatimonadota bacterium]MDR7479016.1 M3 family oligoendopeptidase [Armatimonadota bacterium]MDR7489946.1 M3 family oligoendopeptidase [Armatimonadota bacterium]MDR7500945.1 M3 family oligoendopeptidase [Armatimonadota bacterium]
MAVRLDPRKVFPRRFVPPDADLGRWETIEPLGAALLARTPESPDALERWLEDVSELLAAVGEERARRYIAMTSQTDDPEREHAYLTFIREVEPRMKALLQRLDEHYLASPHRRALPERYRLFDRSVQTRVALFREANLPLEVREAELEQQYQKVSGAMTVTYRGAERTLQQMARFLEEPDRATREEAWRLIAGRRLADREVLDDLYDRLLALRREIARNAGVPTYSEYVWRRRERFDYTPEDCFRFHDAVEAHLVPLAARLHRARQQRLGVERLRPWDLEVDPSGAPPLRPFERPEELAARAEEIFARVDPEFAAQFRFLREEGLLDLASRKGKAPGGYQATLTERRWPFIFMNAVGRDTDVLTLLHEGGHAFNALAVREEPLLAYRHPPMEFAEVASMAMELLTADHLDPFYPDPEERRRAYRHRLERVIRLLPWVATIDAFQHWVYTHPGHSREERRAAWVAAYRRFHPAVDWTGLEEPLGALWHAQLHLFLAPFYYIEYGIAQLGALQVWLRARADYRDAVRRYREALALGGAAPLPALFAAAGARFAFDAGTVAPLAEALSAELDALGEP